MNETDPLSFAHERMHQRLQQPFMLDALLLFEIRVIRFNKEHYFLFQSDHHIIADVFSTNPFLTFIFEGYQRLTQGAND